MIRVLQVNKQYYPDIGGVETVVQQIAEGLKDRTDMKVLCCVTKGKGRRQSINGVDVTYSASLGTLWSMPISFQLLRNMRRMGREADVMICHMPFPLGDLGYMLSGFKGRLYVWWHAQPVRQKKVMWLYRPLMKAFLRRADKIFVATRYHIQSAESLTPFRDKCVIVPFGIDAAQYQVPRGQSQLAKSEHVKILFVGRLVYYKGLDILLKAFEAVKGAELYIVGTGPLLDELKAFAADSPSRESVHFLGDPGTAAIRGCFMDCDIFVLPSVANSEAFGIVQMEAMACGKPVINTWLDTGVPDVSLDGVTGITVQPGDVLQLAEAMQRLTDDERLREAYGENGLKRAMESFSLAGMMDRLYDEISH